jgi:hypothetical protein
MKHIKPEFGKENIDFKVKLLLTAGFAQLLVYQQEAK